MAITTVAMGLVSSKGNALLITTMAAVGLVFLMVNVLRGTTMVA
jgi:hypothetical protein